MCMNKRIRYGEFGKSPKFHIVREFNEARRQCIEKLQKTFCSHQTQEKKGNSESPNEAIRTPVADR